MTEWVFYSFLTIFIFALGKISFTHNLVYAVWALLVVMLCMVAFYAFLGADFVASTQLMIYVGGILVLIVFGLMLSGKTPKDKPIIPIKNKQNFISALIALFFVVVLSKAIWEIPFKDAPTGNEATTSPIAVLLFTKYTFAFELAGILLLVALVGATLIAARQGS